MTQADTALPEIESLDIRTIYYASKKSGGYMGFILHDTDFGDRQPRALWLDNKTHILSVAFNDKSRMPIMMLGPQEVAAYHAAYADFYRTGERASLGLHACSDFNEMRLRVLGSEPNVDKLDEFEAELKKLPSALKVKMTCG